jgi:hypothetical protein
VKVFSPHREDPKSLDLSKPKRKVFALNLGEGDHMLDKAIKFLELPLDKEGGIKWRLNDRPEKARSNRQALFVPYVSIEVVLQRLNRALKEGCIEDWTAVYQILPPLESKDNPSPPVYVSCTLRIKIAGEWHERTDVGSGSDYKDAYSDALKRAARLFGVGAYVAHMEPKYVPVDDRLRPTSEVEFRKEEERVIRRLFPDYSPEHRAEHAAAHHSEKESSRPSGADTHRQERSRPDERVHEPSANPKASSSSPGTQTGDPEVILARLRNAHRAIGDLVSDLKKRGLGVEVARLLLQYRWRQDEIPERPTPEDLDKAINLYRALEAIAKEKPKEGSLRP